MTNLTIYIFGIYQLQMMIRDSIGYLTPKNDQAFKKDAYLKRAETFNILQGEGSPFAHFVTLNKEQSVKLLENLKDFGTDIYSSESTIFRVTGDVVEVDAGQHLKVYDMAIGLYQTFVDIINGYFTYAKENEELDPRLVTLVSIDEYYTRSLAHYALSTDLVKLFKEYSEARSKDKDPNSPVAKFINEDIVKIIGLINFLEKHNKVTNAVYKDMTDKVHAFIEYIAGKRQLPEGKTFPEIFVELKEATLKTLQDAEIKWREAFIPIANEHAAAMEKQRRKQQDLA